MANWKFETSTQRYRDLRSGRFLSSTTLTQLLRTNNSQLTEAVDALNTQLIDKELTVGDWQTQFAQTLKDLHIQNYLLGKGGKNALTQRDYGLIGQKLQGQYRYLQGFSTDLILGGRLTEKQLRARTQLYLNQAAAAFHLGKHQAHVEAGFAWERRVRNALESCSPCIGYASLGWVPIGTLPNPTENCDCKSGCRCNKLYAKEKPEDIFEKHLQSKTNNRKLIGFLR